MADSIREQVVSGLFDILTAMTTGSPTLIQDLSVERVRARPVTVADMPRLVVLEGTQIRDEETGAHKEIVATIPILGFVKAAGDAALGPAINDLYARTVEALEADKTLGLAFVLWSGEEDFEVEFDEEEGHAPAAAFTLSWEVRYQVAVSDPYSAPA